MNENQPQQQIAPVLKNNKAIILLFLQIFGVPFIVYSMMAAPWTGDATAIYIGYPILVIIAVMGFVTSIKKLSREGRAAGIQYVILLITSLILSFVLLLPFISKFL